MHNNYSYVFYFCMEDQWVLWSRGWYFRYHWRKFNFRRFKV